MKGYRESNLAKAMIVRDRSNRNRARTAIAERGQKLKGGHSHPGYIIGIHWLSVAYERICAGEPETDVMRDYGYEYIPRAVR